MGVICFGGAGLALYRISSHALKHDALIQFPSLGGWARSDMRPGRGFPAHTVHLALEDHKAGGLFWKKRPALHLLGPIGSI